MLKIFDKQKHYFVVSVPDLGLSYEKKTKWKLSWVNFLQVLCNRISVFFRRIFGYQKFGGEFGCV